MEILEYLMKFNTDIDTIWDFQLSSFFKIISLHLNHLKFQLKAESQSHAITLVHLDTIINKKSSATGLEPRTT